jgi:predicted AAA+ superfamily ATPase
MLIQRMTRVEELQRRLRDRPVVALLGPRQVGKTTLARQVAQGRRGEIHWFDLESDADLRRLQDPWFALAGLRGLVVLDEIHRRPEIFPALRVLADRPRRPATFLVLGSASESLLRQSSESLAGRITFYELPGFALAEIGKARLTRLWIRGGFPASFVSRSERESWQWRSDFIRTFLSRDVPDFGVRVPATTLSRFWSMLAHVHGQLLSWSELGRSMAVDDHTVRRYVDILAQTFMVRLLPPWFQNISKRQVKAPKIYLRDSGILHRLLEIPDERTLMGHPCVGSSFEGFVIESLLDQLRVEPGQAFFWRTQQGAELDLLIVRGRKRLGFEVKLSSAPSVTPSMRIALADLALTRIDVIHAGTETFPLAPRIRAVAVRDLATSPG